MKKRKRKRIKKDKIKKSKNFIKIKKYISKIKINKNNYLSFI